MGQGAAEHAAARGVGVEALDDVLGDERVEQVAALPPRHVTLLYDLIKASVIIIRALRPSLKIRNIISHNITFKILKYVYN